MASDLTSSVVTGALVAIANLLDNWRKHRKTRRVIPERTGEELAHKSIANFQRCLEWLDDLGYEPRKKS